MVKQTSFIQETHEFSKKVDKVATQIGRPFVGHVVAGVLSMFALFYLKTRSFF